MKQNQQEHIILEGDKVTTETLPILSLVEVGCDPRDSMVLPILTEEKIQELKLVSE